MSEFTLHDDWRADDVVRSELGFVVERVLAKFGEKVLAILLVGGFGRGEGGVIAYGGQYKPVNDYDIIVILKNGRDSSSISSYERKLLENEINRQVSVKQVDLAFLPWYRFLIPSFSVARYEIKNGHKILWGNLAFPIIGPHRSFIARESAFTYLRTRGSGLLIARMLMKGAGNFDEWTRDQLARIEISKALIAIGDAYLIWERSYHYSYVQRRKNIDHISCLPEDIVLKYKCAIDYKLFPERELYPDVTLEKLWQDTADIFLKHLMAFESYIWAERIQEVVQLNRVDTRRSIKLQLMSKENRPPLLLHRLAMALILASIVYGEARLLKDAWLLMHRIKGEVAFQDFSEKEIVLSFLRMWHPGGVVSKILSND